MGNIEKVLLKKQIMGTSSLPSPPAYLMRIMNILKREDPDRNELVDLLERNQTLVAQILKLVNSGYYGLRHEITSVMHAVNLLGIRNVKQVIYSASMMTVFSKFEQSEWDHSYSCSVLMNNIMRSNQLPAAENLPLTCLMHDIGKVVMRRYRPQKYQLLNKQFKEKENPFFDLEESIFKVNHAEVGFWLMEKWQMTEDIAQPILHHHDQTVPEAFVVETAMVQFIDWLDKAAREMPTAPICEELMERAGIEEIDTEYWVNYHRELINSLQPILLG